MLRGSLKYYLWLIAFLLLHPTTLWPQQGAGHFPFNRIEYYNTEQGLNGSEVFWATQDKNGFLWFMTESALNRFDGHSFRSFEYNFLTNSLAWGGYWGILEDSNGKLWIPSTYQGLYSFDPYREKFVQYRHQKENPQSLCMDYITAMAVDENDHIWIGTDGCGIDQLDQATGLFSHFVQFDNDESTITCYYTYGLFPDESHDPMSTEIIWIINSEPGITSINKKTGRLIHNYVFPFRELAENWHQSMTINGIKNNMLWIGSNDLGLYGFNVLSKQYVRLKIDHPCRSDKHFSGFYSVMEDHDGNLWTNNDNNEIVYYEKSTERFYFLPIERNNIHFDFGGMIFEDQCQKVWLCTNNGLISVDTKQKNITSCQHRKGDESSISSNFVQGIARIRQGPLLVGSGSVQVFDKKTNTFSRFRMEKNGQDFNHPESWINQDSKNNIWFSGRSNLTAYNPETKFLHAFHFHDDTTELISRALGGVLEDSKGRYWTAGWYTGLYQFDPTTSYARVYDSQSGPNSIGTDKTGEVFEDSRGIIYTCGWEAGFITLNPETEQFKIYHHDPGDPSSVNNESCHAWIEAKNGLIWFGTFGGGVGVFNPITEKFKSFTTKDSLVHDNVVSLIEDKNGNYWAGTKRGISCFTPPKDPFAPDCNIVFHNYDINDGLPSNVMAVYSSFCDTDGTMFFGTRDAGMFYFHPGELPDNDFIPPVYITDFTLLNKLVNVNDSNSVLKSPIEFTKDIKLNHRQNDFAFKFAALNYIHPGENKYAHMLEGYDEKWIYTDASDRSATYTNLNPGHYTFKVKGSNNDGIWNETPAELAILITPAFWQTASFKLLVLFCILGIAYWFYRFRVRQIMMLQTIRNKIAADLHDDIGSTLNSISIYSDVAAKDPLKRDHALKMIAESSRKIIESMSDIVWTINPQNDSFDKIIFRMSSLTHNILKAKKIECTFKSDDALNDITVPMEIRKNFYLIFKEALNNLVKYSNASRAMVLVSYENKMVTFILRDNGSGFDSTASFNGNGIQNMKRRAKEINANLIIESTLGSGTSIELNLRV